MQGASIVPVNLGHFGFPQKPRAPQEYQKFVCPRIGTIRYDLFVPEFNLRRFPLPSPSAHLYLISDVSSFRFSRYFSWSEVNKIEIVSNMFGLNMCCLTFCGSVSDVCCSEFRNLGHYNIFFRVLKFVLAFKLLFLGSPEKRI